MGELIGFQQLQERQDEMLEELYDIPTPRRPDESFLQYDERVNEKAMLRGFGQWKTEQLQASARASGVTGESLEAAVAKEHPSLVQHPVRQRQFAQAHKYWSGLQKEHQAGVAQAKQYALAAEPSSKKWGEVFVEMDPATWASFQESLSGFVKPRKRGKVAKGVTAWRRGAKGVKEQFQAFIDVFVRQENPDWFKPSGAGRFAEAQRIVRGADPTAGPKAGWVERGVVSGLEMGPPMAAGGLAAAVFPPAGVAFWTMQIAPARTAEFIERGMPVEQAKNAGLLTGMVESVIEMAGRLAGPLPKGYARAALEVAKRYAKEVGEEPVQESASEAIYSIASGDTDLDRSIGQIWDSFQESIIPVAMLAGAGPVAGGALRAARAAPSVVRGLPQPPPSVTPGMRRAGEFKLPAGATPAERAMTRKGAEEYVRMDPERARRLANLETITRRQLAGAGITGTTNAAQRAKLSEMIRETLAIFEKPKEAQRAEEAPREAEAPSEEEGVAREPGREVRVRDAAQPEKGAAEDRVAAEAPAEAKRAAVQSMKVSDIEIDPQRFQFRIGKSKLGTTGRLAGVEKWEPSFAGIVAVWKDPADGKTYVVNGHHRLALASKTGRESLEVRFIEAESAEEARAKGAMINIAEGQATAMETAKVFRDMDVTADQLREQGLKITENVAAGGIALAQLDQNVWNAVVAGEIPEAWGVSIGEHVADEANQRKLYQMLKKRRKAGKKTTPGMVNEMAQMVKEAPLVKEAQMGLGGDLFKSLAPIVASIREDVRTALGQTKRLLATVTREGAVGILARYGTHVDVESAEGQKRLAAVMMERFDIVKKTDAAVREVIHAGAERQDGGAKHAEIVRQVTADVTRLLSEPGRPEARAEGAGVRGGMEQTGLLGEEGGISAIRVGARPAIERVESAPGNPFDIPVKMPTTEGPMVSNHDIIRTLERDFSVPIRVGHMAPGAAAGFYRGYQEVVRMRGQFAGDLAIASHEVAHHIAKTQGVIRAIPRDLRDELRGLDYEPGKARIGEGFAEYVRMALTDDTAASAAPAFTQWFTQEWLPKHPDIKEKLAAVRSLIDRWREQGAGPRVRGARATEPARVEPGLLTKIEKGMLDDLTGLENFVRAVAEKRGAPLPSGQDPYVLARVLGKAGPAHAEDAVNKGVFSLKTGQRMSPSILEALEKITPEEFEEFVDFIHAQHGLDVWKTGRGPGISQADAQHVYDEHKGKTHFVEAGKMLTAWNKALIDMLAEVGALSPEGQKAIKDAFPHYIPLKRVVDTMRKAGIKGGMVDIRGPVYRMKGSGRQVLHPLASMILSATQFYTVAGKMIVGNAIVDAAATVKGMGPWVEQIAKPPPRLVKLEKLADQLEKAGADLTDADMEAMILLGQATGFYKGGEPIAGVYRDGKLKWYQFHPDLHDAVARMDSTQLPHYLQVTLGAATKLKRAGATGLRASFGLIFNPIRDIVLGAIQTTGSPVKLVYRTLGNYFRVGLSKLKSVRGTQDPYFAIWKQFSGDLSGYIGQDIRHTYRHVQELVNQAQGRPISDIVLNPVDLLTSIARGVQEGLSVTEAAPRIAEMQAVFDKYGYSRADLNAGKTPPMGVIMEAMMAANQVTTDFKRGGSAMRMWNRVEAYSNARIQGVVQPIRRFKEHPIRYFCRATAMLTLPTLAYWALQRDEDWYEELPAWQRFLFWNFKVGNTVIRIPRPFEVGMIFASMYEAIADSIYRQDPERGKQFVDELFPGVSQTAEYLLPDAIQPIVEITSNYDLWRQRPIVGEGMRKGRKPEDQWYDYNTAASKYLGHWLSVSPAKIDHLIANYTGGMGTDIARIPEEGPARAIGYGRLMRPWERGQTVNQFYDERARLRQERGSAKAKGVVPRELESRYDRFEMTGQFMTTIRNEARKFKDKEKRRSYDVWITGLARFAEGRPELADYPNPFKAKNLPSPIAKARDECLGRAIFRLIKEKATPQQQESEARILRDMGLTKAEVMRLYEKHAGRRGMNTQPTTSTGKLTAYGRGLYRLSGRF